jgi:putative ABC transport system ATP-binding protein
LSIKLVEVDKKYTFSENHVNALRGVNLQIEKGEFAALIGPAGSGKTTLLNLISAQDKPSSGKIHINGSDLTGLKKRQLAKFRRTTLGFILQAYNHVPVLSVYENIELPMLAAGVSAKERRSRIQELLKLAELTELTGERPNELSVGDRQRLAVLCAFANKPSIVLADEPTGDLDSQSADEIVKLLHSLSKREDTTVIIATQDPAMAGIADRVFQIGNGAIKEQNHRAAASALKLEVFENTLAGSILT